MTKLVSIGCAAVFILWTTVALAAHCCQRCGAPCCRKVCRIVCETKKTPHVTYTCECEDFCVPHRSQRCGSECTCDCNGCVTCEPKFVPTTAEVRTRAKLIKHVEEKETKPYKWVVEYLCSSCACQANGGACAANPQALAQPVTDDAVVETLGEQPPLVSDAAAPAEVEQAVPPMPQLSRPKTLWYEMAHQ